MTFAGPIQIVVAEPGTGTVAWKLSQLFRDAWAEGQRRVQLWLPPRTHLPPGSPWQALLQLGLVKPGFLPMPSLLVVSDAADWTVARRVYGGHGQLPVMQLLWGCDLRCWGHGALRQPAIRVALGPAVAEGWRRDGRLLEPLHTLPIGLDPEDLPHAQSRVLGQGRQQRVLVLAGRNPGLGLAVQEQLRARGLTCSTELSPWPFQRWLQAMAEAAVAVVLAPQSAQPMLSMRHLAAMALQTPLVCDQHSHDDHLCRDGVNALVRSADAGALAEAAASVLASPSLQRVLVDGGLATLVRHRRARERLQFDQLLDDHQQHWQQARTCHHETAAIVSG